MECINAMLIKWMAVSKIQINEKHCNWTTINLWFTQNCLRWIEWKPRKCFTAAAAAAAAATVVIHRISHRSINERSNYTLHIRCARENKISFEWRNKWHYAWRWCNYGNRSAMHIAHIMRIRMTLHCNGSHTQSILDWAFRMCCSNFSASDSKKSASVRVNVEKWTQLITDQFCERINEMRCNFDCKNSEFHAVWSLSEWICHINF